MWSCVRISWRCMVSFDYFTVVHFDGQSCELMISPTRWHLQIITLENGSSTYIRRGNTTGKKGMKKTFRRIYEIVCVILIFLHAFIVSWRLAVL